MNAWLEALRENPLGCIIIFGGLVGCAVVIYKIVKRG